MPNFKALQSFRHILIFRLLCRRQRQLNGRQIFILGKKDTKFKNSSHIFIHFISTREFNPSGKSFNVCISGFLRDQF